MTYEVRISGKNGIIARLGFDDKAEAYAFMDYRYNTYKGSDDLKLELLTVHNTLNIKGCSE